MLKFETMLKSHYREVAENQDKHWWYLGMAAINSSLLDKYLPKRMDLKILDAGCGTGAMLMRLAKYGDVVGVDISGEALKYARRRGKVQKGDVTNLGFRDKTFDLVVCLDVIYHLWVKDEMQALQEFNRVLKKDGILLLREPAYNWLRGNQDRVGLTARRFSKTDLKNKLERSSFRVETLSYVNFFLFPIILPIRLLGSLINKKKDKSDFFTFPPFLNFFLYTLLKVEGYLIKFLPLPFGSSLICVARKA